MVHTMAGNSQKPDDQVPKYQIAHFEGYGKYHSWIQYLNGQQELQLIFVILRKNCHILIHHLKTLMH